MTPERFCIEVPQRMRRLMDAMYPVAQQHDLTTSFALMVAMPLLMIPLERTNTRNTMNDVDEVYSFVGALRLLKLKLFWDRFLSEPELLHNWRYTEISRKIDSPSEWRDTLDRHPMRPGARNDIKEQDVENVLLTLRHALAHGNVVYLNEDGEEAPGRKVTHLAFVSEPRNGRPGYRVLIVEETAFIEFLKTWSDWIGQFNLDSSMRRAA